MTEEEEKAAYVKLLESYLEKLKSGELKIVNIEQTRDHDSRCDPLGPLNGKMQYRFSGRSTLKLWFVGEAEEWP